MRCRVSVQSALQPLRSGVYVEMHQVMTGAVNAHMRLPSDGDKVPSAGMAQRLA